MSIKSKIIGGLIAVVCLFVAISVISYNRGRHTNERLLLVNEAFLPLFRQVVQLQTNLSGLAEDMRRYYFQRSEHSSSERSSFSKMVRDIYPYIIQKRFLTIERLLEKRDGRGYPAFSNEIKALINPMKADFEGILLSQEAGDFEPRFQKVKAQLTSLMKQIEEECKALTGDVQAENREFLYAGLVLSVLMCLAGILTILFSYRVLNPLPQLIASVKKIADGDFHQSLKVKASDEGEVAVLAREYNRMLEALRERDKKIISQQKEILQSEKLAAVGQLSAEVVHEIRNPLNSINLNIDWLKSELATQDTEVQKTFDSITREIARLGEITESYLVRARVSTGESENASINEVLNEIIDFDTEFNEKIRVEKKLWPEELFVRADKGRLKQAFLNVIKNAKEAMPAGGELFVKTERNRNTFDVIIQDTGCGMTESTRNRAQEPFFSTKANGTGIGLSVTREIIEEAHGTLDFETGLGKGTSVKMKFPV